MGWNNPTTPTHGNPRQSTVKKKPCPKPPTYTDEEEGDEIKVRPFPLLQTTRQENTTEPAIPPDRVPNTLEPIHQTVQTPASECRDPTYAPS
jgi:hypothetical protein